MEFVGHHTSTNKKEKFIDARLQRAKIKCLEFFNRHSNTFIDSENVYPGPSQDYMKAVNKLENLSKKREVYTRIADKYANSTIADEEDLKYNYKRYERSNLETKKYVDTKLHPSSNRASCERTYGQSQYSSILKQRNSSFVRDLSKRSVPSSALGIRSHAVSPASSSPIHLQSSSKKDIHSPSSEYKGMKLSNVSQLLVSMKKQSHKDKKEIKRLKKEILSKSKKLAKLEAVFEESQDKWGSEHASMYNKIAELQKIVNSKDTIIEGLEVKMSQEQELFNKEIEELTQNFEVKIQDLKKDKHARIKDLGSQINMEKETCELYKDKLKQLSTYVKTAKELLQYKNDTNLDKYLASKEVNKDSTFEEENLLKPISDHEFDVSQNMFSMEQKYDQDVKINRAAELSNNLTQLEAEMYKNEVCQLKNEIVALARDTKIMIQVIDKVLPRENADPIDNLLDFGKEKGKMSIEEELDQILMDENDKSEISISKAVQEVRMIRKNIINLKNMGYSIIRC
ncbi:unnamed protein product [Moneuplotes crassus]|uniref:Uncharacterized protein n=1 Tax=Euplotes crassus TaxID=5936 RepID=A0AAD1X3Y1_EUPCR|nr:unnamed protein product [Moneuplotes crassus]